MERLHRNLVKLILLAALVFAGTACGGGSSESTDQDSGDQTPRDVTSLQAIDEVVGTGTTATVGRQLSVYYTGSLYDAEAEDLHGEVFDKVVSGDPFAFTLGAGEVIAGWEQGLVGMKEGGKRILIIPSRLAYGRQGAGPIPPNTAVVFDIELLAVE